MQKHLAIFFAAIMIFLGYATNIPVSFAQETKAEELITQEQTAQATPAAYINYDLAFPGMLPDNKLYKLKVLRDKITLGLITDPKKKVEYLLLQTDKGILAAAMLVDKKEIALAKETALKAENNITLATYELWRFTKKIDSDLYDKLRTASLKHQEVLSSLLNRISKEDAKSFKTVIEFSKRNWVTIENYRKDFERQSKIKNSFD